jgi:lipoprotein-anchoring transpeptidase ErfK/SrfK
VSAQDPGPSFQRRSYSILLVLWIGVFAWKCGELALWTSRLAASTQALEDAAAALTREARDNAEAVKQARAGSDELAFLQELPNILPQDKGYIRTQKAIMGEVQALRRKLSGRLAGSLHVLVDAKANKLYLKDGFKLLWSADVSVGRGGVLIDKKSGRRWEFVTPRGEFRVIAKGENVAWRKPDWAYVEEKQPPPPPDDPSRLVQGELGAYVLNLGDGYLIHGTKNEASLGRPASHGCVRVGAEDLAKLYAAVPLGTRVFIFY